MALVLQEDFVVGEDHVVFLEDPVMVLHASGLEGLEPGPVVFDEDLFLEDQDIGLEDQPG